MATTLSRAICLMLLIGGVVRAAGGRWQDPAQDPARPTFSTESDLVVLHVTVFDRHGDPVPRLTGDVFHVVEDGMPQTISVFSGEDAPVAVGLVVDNSSSMLTRTYCMRMTRELESDGQPLRRSSRAARPRPW